MNKNIVSIKGTPYGLVFYFDTTQAGFGQVCAALEEKLLHSGDFFINAEYIIDQPSVFSEEELAIIEGILKNTILIRASLFHALWKAKIKMK